MVSASPGNTYVDLVWNSSAGATEYLVSWGTASGSYSSGSTTVTATNYRVTGLSNSTLYYFSVAAINTIGRTTVTTEATATPVKPTVYFSTSSQSKNENASSANVVLTLNQALAHDLVVNISLSGTAVSGVNFSYTGGTAITIPAGATTATLTPQLIQDNLVSGNKTLIFNLVTDSEYFNGATNTHTLTITDIDTLPVVNLSASTLSVSESATSATLTIQLSKTYGATTSVNYTTANGTGTAGTDYTSTSGTLSFAAGETSKTVSIPITNNNVYNGNRTLSFSLSSPSSLTLGSTTTTTVTITDDDPYSVLFTANPTVDVNSCLTVNLSLVNNQNASTTARVSTTVNLATGSGGAFYSASDCTSVITSVVFAIGDSTSQVYFKSSQAGVLMLSSSVAPTNLNMVAGGTGVAVVGARAVSIGTSHTCAIGTNGQIYCWGVNISGRLGDGTSSTGWSFTPTAINYTLPTGVVFTQVVAGTNSSCALLSNGSVLCWGYNNVGQIGDGTLTTRTSPTLLTGLGSEPISMISGSSYGSTFCALIRAYKVKCWGDNASGQTGTGTIGGYNSSPVDVNFTLPTGTSISSIAVGSNHVCLSLSNNSVRCWGSNAYSQLGNGLTTNSATPIDPGVSNVLEVFTGYNSTCVLLLDTTSLCWGINGYSSLANGVSGNSTTTPSPLKTNSTTNLSGIRKIIMGNSYNIALTDSNIYMSGVNTRGQFLNFSNLVSQNYMTALTGVPALKSLTTGGSGTVCGLRASDNQIVCWGDSGHGQAGTSSLTNYFGFRPIYTSGFTSVTAIGVSDAHACAVNSGSTYCWGWAQAGRLSIGTVVNTSTPVLVKEGSNTTNLTAFLVHSLWDLFLSVQSPRII